MATTRRVTCVDKSSNDHQGIIHLGGKQWRATRSQVVRDIESGTYEYYTDEDGKRAEVLVRTRDGVKFVQTKADGVWTDNLLALKGCQ